MTTADVAAVPLSDIEHRGHLRRAVIASTVGTTIEWYDFLLYGQSLELPRTCILKTTIFVREVA